MPASAPNLKERCSLQRPSTLLKEKGLGIFSPALLFLFFYSRCTQGSSVFHVFMIGDHIGWCPWRRREFMLFHWREMLLLGVNISFSPFHSVAACGISTYLAEGLPWSRWPEFNPWNHVKVDPPHSCCIVRTPTHITGKNNNSKLILNSEQWLEKSCVCSALFFIYDRYAALRTPPHTHSFPSTLGWG